MIQRFTEIVKMSSIATEKFINHCIGVYNILKENKFNDNVCKAGLYHSIYGTSYFNATVLSAYNTNDRELVKKEIGEYAENLVYEMCILPDRERNILMGNVNWELNFFKDIVSICHANLIELQQNEKCPQHINKQIDLYEVLLSFLKNKINPFTINNPIKNNIKVFDNILSYSENLNLFLHCKNNSYSLNLASSLILSQRNDTLRFSCQLNPNSLMQMNLHPILKKIANEVGQDLFFYSYYIGYYDKSTCSADHVDAFLDDYITILIYPNSSWEELWAGDIKFYNEETVFNTSIDFIPGRIIVFDSKIKHKVMPISPLAKEGRFSIALKATLFKNVFDIIDDRTVHISCD